MTKSLTSVRQACRFLIGDSHSVEQDRQEPTQSRNSGFEVAESEIDTLSFPMEEENAETPTT